MIDSANAQRQAAEYTTYDEAFRRVAALVDRTLTASPIVIREYTSHLARSNGKYLRTASLLACAMNEDDLVHCDAVLIATAIEIIHLATLVHDDIIDNADLRRGEPSLQKKFGKRTAVICGDYLLCAALRIASGAEDRSSYVSRGIPDYMGKVCLGELSQHIHSGDNRLSVYRYLKIIAGKTAALFEAAFHGGALLAGDDDHAIKRYAKLGKYVGMIFQLTDDCMDYEATEETAKKPVRSDYDQNVVTLPLIHAFRRVDGLREKSSAGPVTFEEIGEAVRASGGLIYTRMVAKKYRDKALAALDSLELTDAKRERLLDILNKAYRVF